ncbi:winged helix-turn-helix domain-containing protein [uncultured Sulfitobacter sp.]|uniref:winged helix-turn-helix domain-containing protein n=1 Tax=uncultured Sulfitobacter sp. TaxID=191468 RepID=UPI0030DD11CB|tara:strand:+ start:3798 stop:4265 length:468 start_codon:yes stop_codon:yes gene_type:complete
MNEQDARARMVADITASFSEDMPFPSLMYLHKSRGFDPIQIKGDHPENPVGAEFRRDWKANVDLKVMAHKYGVSASTISRWADKAGLRTRHSKVARAVKSSKALKAAWEAGVSMEQIAEALNVSPSTVWRAARRDRLSRGAKKAIPTPQFQGAAE